MDNCFDILAQSLNCDIPTIEKLVAFAKEYCDCNRGRNGEIRFLCEPENAEEMIGDFHAWICCEDDVWEDFDFGNDASITINLFPADVLNHFDL